MGGSDHESDVGLGSVDLSANVNGHRERFWKPDTGYRRPASASAANAAMRTRCR